MSQKKYEFSMRERMAIFYIAFIVVGALMLSYAVSLQRAYNNAPSKLIDPNLEGFAVTHNVTKIEMGCLLMAIILEPPTLAISYQFELEKNDTYSILFRFPFRIKEINNTVSFPVHADFHLINNQTFGSLFLNEIYAQEDSGKVKEYISCDFPIEETFISGRRGSYFANVRFTYLAFMGTTLLDEIGYNQSLWSQEYIESLVPIKNFFLFFLYPERMTITQVFPAFTVGPVRWPPPIYLPNMTSITWHFEELEARELSTLVYYYDNDEYDKYQQMLFNSGLWYGLGFSAIIAGIFEFVRVVLSQPQIEITKDGEKREQEKDDPRAPL